MDNELQPEGFNAAEKLALVAGDMMDPKEIGMVSKEEAQLEILKQEAQLPVMENFITFEVSEVPMHIRARWARKDLTIIPTEPRSWEADWIEENKDTHRVQSIARCGSLALRMEGTYTDAMLGFINLMENAAKALKAQYEKQIAKVVDVESEIVQPSSNGPTVES